MVKQFVSKRQRMHTDVCQIFMLQKYSQAIETLISLTPVTEKCFSFLVFVHYINVKCVFSNHITMWQMGEFRHMEFNDYCEEKRRVFLVQMPLKTKKYHSTCRIIMFCIYG